MLIKNISKYGSKSHCIVLDQTLMGLLDANPTTAFKVTVEGKKLVLEPLSEKERHEIVMEVGESVLKSQAEVFKKLAK